MDAERRAKSNRETFPARVFSIVAQIPEGRVTTYGRIARALGDPRGARMVGWALHAGHLYPDHPCHRVINRNGELSGRLHWGDPDLMQRLLEGEGIEFNESGRVDLQRFGWDPGDDEWASERSGPVNEEDEAGE